MVHCPQGGSARAGSSQPLLLSLKCIESAGREAVRLEAGKNTIVVSAKKTFEIISRFCHSCGLKGFSELGGPN